MQTGNSIDPIFCSYFFFFITNMYTQMACYTNQTNYSVNIDLIRYDDMHVQSESDDWLGDDDWELI